MNTPLYKDHRSPDKPAKDAHAGLWFERFFNRYEKNWEIIKESQTPPKKEGKKDWIDLVKGERGDALQLNEFKTRQQNLVTVLNGQSRLYTTDWNFVSGMGNPHPVENGFSWHPTLAVPYLAGSAVKGLVRAWVEMNDEELSSKEKDARLKSWFGTVYKNDVAEQAGDFIFFDAIPDKQPELVCDIMTPHMKDWYQNGDTGSTKLNDVPADWHEPTPIPFLVVKKARFVFGVVPRPGQDNIEIGLIFEALESALCWLGAGAKTAAGYGYMSNNVRYEQEQLDIETERQEIAKANAIAQKIAEQHKDSSPLVQEYLIAAESGDWYNNRDIFVNNNVLGVWLDKLEQLEKVEEEILNDLIRLINKHLKPGLLEFPNKPKGNKFFYKDKQRKIAERINSLTAKK